MNARLDLKMAPMLKQTIKIRFQVQMDLLPMKPKKLAQTQKIMNAKLFLQILQLRTLQINSFLQQLFQMQREMLPFKQLRKKLTKIQETLKSRMFRNKISIKKLQSNTLKILTKSVIMNMLQSRTTKAIPIQQMLRMTQIAK